VLPYRVIIRRIPGSPACFVAPSPVFRSIACRPIRSFQPSAPVILTRRLSRSSVPSRTTRGIAFSEFLISLISSSELSVIPTLKTTLSRQWPEQTRLPAGQVLVVSSQPRFSRHLCVASAECRAVSKDAEPLARASRPTALTSLSALLCKKSTRVSPFCSGSCELFKKAYSCNSFSINRFRTLLQNTGGCIPPGAKAPSLLFASAPVTSLESALTKIAGGRGTNVG